MGGGPTWRRLPERDVGRGPPRAEGQRAQRNRGEPISRTGAAGSLGPGVAPSGCKVGEQEPCKCRFQGGSAVQGRGGGGGEGRAGPGRRRTKWRRLMAASPPPPGPPPPPPSPPLSPQLSRRKTGRQLLSSPRLTWPGARGSGTGA